MTHPAETASTRKTGRSPVYLLCLLLGVSAVVPAFAPDLTTKVPTKPAVAGAASAEAKAGIEAAPSWIALSQTQQQALQPLKAFWRTMSPAQHRKWELIANRIGRMAPQAKQRLLDRMETWARLTPVERARARLNFLQLKNHAARPKADRPRPDRAVSTGHPAIGLQIQRSLPPAMVRVAPGATTVLLTTTFHVPAVDRSVTSTPPNGAETNPPDAINTPMPS
jgi:hypothetical protein